MRPPASPRISRRATLLAWVAIACLASAGGARDERAWRDFRGSCYCRAQGELTCTAELTERECTRRSKEALCDEWFWNERLACWSWGYGG